MKLVLSCSIICLLNYSLNEQVRILFSTKSLRCGSGKSSGAIMPWNSEHFFLSLYLCSLGSVCKQKDKKGGWSWQRRLWVRQRAELRSELEKKLHPLCCLFHFHYLICYVSSLCCSLLFFTASVCNMGQNICLNQWQPSASPPLIMTEKEVVQESNISGVSGLRQCHTSWVINMIFTESTIHL